MQRLLEVWPRGCGYGARPQSLSVPTWTHGLGRFEVSGASVNRLGIDGRLAKTLVTSNPVESMISIARTTNRNVTRWRDGHMVLRWTAAGMLNAERSFRRIKGLQADGSTGGAVRWCSRWCRAARGFEGRRSRPGHRSRP